MFDDEKAAIVRIQTQIENKKSDNWISEISTMALDDCLYHLRLGMVSLERVDASLYGYVTGPDLKRPQCDIDGTCGNAINDTGCHERWTCL